MSLDWVGTLATACVGAAGVFFTWLTGRQARSQVMEMAALSLKQGEQQRVREERREAYFAVLRLAYINSYRQKYERCGDEVHLRQVEERWPGPSAYAWWSKPTSRLTCTAAKAHGKQSLSGRR